MAKVYDCFSFFNELDLLALRLEELDPVVDHFVIVEATKTFQKKDKPLYFKQNQDLFKKYKDKIIHVVVDKYPTFFTRFRVPGTWDYDNAQKEFILKGLKDASPDDVIIVSDLDEFPLAEKVTEYKNKPGIRVFEQFIAFYYLNNVCTHINEPDPRVSKEKNHDGYGYWRGSVMLEYKLIKNIKSTRMYRDLPNDKMTLIRNGGWHFSYMGGVDMIVKKIEAWTHAEFNKPEFKDPDYILKSIYEGRSLFEDQSRFKVIDVKNGEVPYPQALLKNLEKYKDMILPYTK